MTDRPYRGRVDRDRLSGYLKVLANPARVLLLERLRVPMISSEIRIPVHRRDDGAGGRLMSRQAVEVHLRRLEGVGLVRSRRVRRGGRPREEWFTNQAELYRVVDEMRRLSLLQAGTEGGTIAATTGRASPVTPGPRMPPGPALVLVTGPSEGRVLPLEGPGPWVVGRAAGTADLGIPYDPYVSTANTRLHGPAGAMRLEALADSRNGTTLNWTLLEPGAVVPVRGGDTIGVGRSLLVYREGGS